LSLFDDLLPEHLKERALLLLRDADSRVEDFSLQLLSGLVVRLVHFDEASFFVELHGVCNQVEQALFVEFAVEVAVNRHGICLHDLEIDFSLSHHDFERLAHVLHTPINLIAVRLPVVVKVVVPGRYRQLRYLGLEVVVEHPRLAPDHLRKPQSILFTQPIRTFGVFNKLLGEAEY